MSDFIDCEQVKRILDVHLSERADRFQEQIQAIADLCRSPIEGRLAVALLGTVLFPQAHYAFTRCSPKDGDYGIFVVPQMPVGKYYADFAIFCRYAFDEVRLAIECDGHDFHEKTKEQAAHDKARDRFFLQSGWPTMRFTGSEIFRDADACANQVVEFLLTQMIANRQRLDRVST